MPDTNAKAEAPVTAAPAANDAAKSTDASKSADATPAITETPNSFSRDGELWVKQSNLNAGFFRIWTNATSGINGACDPLKDWGKSLNTDSWWEVTKWMAKKATYKPQTRLIPLTLTIADRTNPFYKILTAYLDRQYEDSKSSLAVQEISESRHFIIRTIRDALLKIDEFYKADSTKLIQHYQYIIKACYHLKDVSHWPDSSIYTQLFPSTDSTDKQTFYGLINTIKWMLKKRIERIQAAAESTVLTDSLNAFDTALDQVIDIRKDISLRSIFGDQPIPGDIFSHPDHDRAFRKMIPLDELKKLDDKAYDKQLKEEYDEFKGNKAIQPGTKELINSQEKFYMVRVLFYMADEQRKINELEAKAAKDEISNLVKRAENEENRQMMAGSEQLPSLNFLAMSASGKVSSSSEMLAASDSNTADSSKSQDVIVDEYNEIDSRRLVLIAKIQTILPSAIQTTLATKTPKEASARQACEGYLSTVRRGLEVDYHLVYLKGIVTHIKQIISGLGNFAKPTALPQIQTMYTRAKTLLNNLVTLLELHQEASSNLQQHVTLNSHWTTNSTQIDIQSQSLMDIIKTDALPALQKLNESLNPDNIMTDMLRVVSAFESVNARLRLLGDHCEITPFYQSIKDVTVASIIAARRKQAPQALGQNDSYLQFKRTFATAAAKSSVPGDLDNEKNQVLDHQDTIKQTQPFFDRSQDFTVRIFQPSRWWLLWATGIGFLLHGILMLGALVYRLATSGTKAEDDRINEILNQKRASLEIRLSEIALNSTKAATNTSSLSKQDLITLLITQLNNEKTQLLDHQDTIKLTQAKFDHSEDWAEKIFQPNRWWLLWATGVGFVLHGFLMIAAVVYSALTSTSREQEVEIFDTLANKNRALEARLKQIEKELEEISRTPVKNQTGEPAPKQQKTASPLNNDKDKPAPQAEPQPNLSDAPSSTLFNANGINPPQMPSQLNEHETQALEPVNLDNYTKQLFEKLCSGQELNFPLPASNDEQLYKVFAVYLDSLENGSKITTPQVRNTIFKRLKDLMDETITLHATHIQTTIPNGTLKSIQPKNPAKPTPQEKNAATRAFAPILAQQESAKGILNTQIKLAIFAKAKELLLAKPRARSILKLVK